MELLSVIRVLARRRILVALGVLPALLAGAMAAGMLPFGPGSTPGAASGLAQTRVNVDRPTAAVADTAEITDTLGKQAALLTDIISGDAQRNEIARRAGIPAAHLGMQQMQLAQLAVHGQLAKRAAEASATIARPYVVNVWAADPLPVLTVDVVGPTGADAARVARATRGALRALAAARAPSAKRGIVIKSLGKLRAVDVPASAHSKIVAPAAVIGFFIFWLCAVVVFTGLQRGWRNATAGPAAATPG